MHRAILLAGASVRAIAYCLRVQALDDWRASARVAIARGWSGGKTEATVLTSIALTAPPPSPWWPVRPAI